MPNSTDSHDQFGQKLGLIARLWRAEVDRRLAPLGLTQARWYILLKLQRLTETVTQKDLAEAANIQGPTLVRTLDCLEKEGLIRRCPLPGDRRAKAVRLTDKAAPLLDHIQAVATSVRAEMLADIPAEDLDACIRVFDRIAERLSTIQTARTAAPAAKTPETP